MENITKGTALNTMAKRAGDTVITYAIMKKGMTYTLSVSSTKSFCESAFIEDVARDAVTAERIGRFFAENLVFPNNVLEVFDDILAGNCI